MPSSDFCRSNGSQIGNKRNLNDREILKSYWPSTKPSIKRCTCVNKRKKQAHPAEDVGISPWPMDVVEFGTYAYTHRKQVDAKQLYNLGPQTTWVSWSSSCSQLVSSSQFEFSSSRSWRSDASGVRTSSRQRGRALGTPVEQPSRMRKKNCYGQRNLGPICGSLCPSPTHLSHITNINPFATISRIKCERYIFLKMCVRSFIEPRHYVSAYIYMYMRIQHYKRAKEKLLCTWETLILIVLNEFVSVPKGLKNELRKWKSEEKIEITAFFEIGLNT